MTRNEPDEKKTSESAKDEAESKGRPARADDGQEAAGGKSAGDFDPLDIEKRGDDEPLSGSAFLEKEGIDLSALEELAFMMVERDEPESTAGDTLLSRFAMESLLTYLDQEGGVVGQTDLDKAQELMYQAWEAPSEKQAVELARNALERSPDCADAYRFLAMTAAASPEETVAYCRQAVAAGERALGKATFENHAGHFWGLLETRPYMRARVSLCSALWRIGHHEEAIAHHLDMLRLNPNDNQGIRYVLMPQLLLMGRDDEAETLYEQFESDGMAAWSYSRVLLDFRKHGDAPVADESLRQALDINKHVPPLLLGRKKVPKRLPGNHGFGDVNEAVVYAYYSMGAWRETPGALDWLEAKTKPAPEREDNAP